ncbi:MAG: AAA family ATPase [Lachnospiraceae bacterium]|nr:AAA family ATPase [Lachnospiraceae bacterium]
MGMVRTVSIGCQEFERFITEGYFYIDKTAFLKEWWENADIVTLITRPRRFGKTLTMNMVETFFSIRYTGRGELFEGLSIWKEEAYRKLQGSYPVLFLSFAGMKGAEYHTINHDICDMLTQLFRKHAFLLEGDCLLTAEREEFEAFCRRVPEVSLAEAFKKLTEYLYRYYGKKVIVLLDEYDTPLQEAYINGYWEEIVSVLQRFFHAALKTNPSLERALLTGVTRISKESIFSDLNHLEVVTITSDKYADKFGFTEEEVFRALEEYGLSDKKTEVKSWYDGFTFGTQTDIYNPWSIINYLDKRKVGSYWVNTSSNHLAGTLIQKGNAEVKQEFELLLSDQTITTELEEQIAFHQLTYSRTAIWSLLLASGYLKVVRTEFLEEEGEWQYTLALTNREVKWMFLRMVREWFAPVEGDYNNFIKALLLDDQKAMNQYMNEVALTSFSYFDTGNKPSEKLEPERFYHGFVLGLMVELSGRYVLTSNRESGFGRYDIMLEPRQKQDDAIIIEFKVHDPEEEKTLEETVVSALKQIEEKQYYTALIAKGIAKDHIRSYGFAFEGKKVRIGSKKNDFFRIC